MGQAKIRGTKEERVAEGIKRREYEEAEYLARRQARWNKLTPEERRNTIEFASLAVMFGGLGVDPIL